MKRLLAVIVILSCAAPVLAEVNSPYGINTHVPNSSVLDLVSHAGIGWIRIDMNWFMLEPARDQYNWGYMDAVVNQARARGLEIFATLAYTPAWANATGNIADPPADVADWSDFVYDAVNRYKNNIKYWGMWNEPDLDGFFTGEPWQYREWILKPGAQAARSADPSCKIVGPELAHLKSADWPNWMEEAMKAGGSDSIDIISHHCYSGDTGDEIFQKLDDGFYWAWDDPPLMTVLKNLGVDDKPVWLTEVGWHTDDVSQDDQALFYHQILWGMLQRDWLDKVFFYEIIDDPTPGVSKWGIVQSDYTPKTAYYTYRDFIANPSAPPSSGNCSLAGEPGARDVSGILLILAVMLAAKVLTAKRGPGRRTRF